jgi:hypothetical protein
VFSTLKRNPIFLAVAAVVLVAVLWFAWWTISPLFIRTTLVEGQNINVPAASAPAQDGDMAVKSGDMVDKPADDMAKPEDKMSTEAAGAAMEAPTVAPVVEDKPVDDMATPEDKMAGGSGSVSMETPVAGTMTQDKPQGDMMEGKAEGAAMGEDKAMEEPMGPKVLAVGNFDRKDDIHYANGQAIVAREEDGSYVLRLQDLDAANGPDLYVYVSEHPDPSNSDELNQGGHNLGNLKATTGSFSYALDPSIEPAKIKSVVIYCKAFNVIFSTAALQMQ